MDKKLKLVEVKRMGNPDLISEGQPLFEIVCFIEVEKDKAGLVFELFIGNFVACKVFV